MLRRITEPTRDIISHPGLDLSQPHITGFLADDAPLRDKVLSTSEVFTVLFLSIKSIMAPEYKKQHRVAPVSSCLLRQLLI